MPAAPRRTAAAVLMALAGALLCGCPHPIKAIRDLVTNPPPASPKTPG